MPPVRPSAGPPGKLAPRGDRRDRGLRHRLPLARGGGPDRVPDHEGFTRPGRRVRRRPLPARFPPGPGVEGGTAIGGRPGAKPARGHALPWQAPGNTPGMVLVVVTRHTWPRAKYD